MREWAGKRYWIVGASQGLGRALAECMSRTGVELVLSARSEDRLRDLAEALPGRAEAVPCDLRDAASVARAAEAAGEIDGIVYTAAVCRPLTAAEWDPERAETMVDVNLAGCLRVLGRVVPGMVARGRGHVVLTGSLSAYRGVPGNIGFGATQAAIMNLAQSLRADLDGTGVEVQLANPGRVRASSTDRTPGAIAPDAAARHIFEHMNGEALTRAFPFWPGLGFRLGRFLPDAVWHRLVR